MRGRASTHQSRPPACALWRGGRRQARSCSRAAHLVGLAGHGRPARHQPRPAAHLPEPALAQAMLHHIDGRPAQLHLRPQAPASGITNSCGVTLTARWAALKCLCAEHGPQQPQGGAAAAAGASPWSSAHMTVACVSAPTAVCKEASRKPGTVCSSCAPSQGKGVSTQGTAAHPLRDLRQLLVVDGLLACRLWRQRCPARSPTAAQSAGAILTAPARADHVEHRVPHAQLAGSGTALAGWQTAFAELSAMQVQQL